MLLSCQTLSTHCLGFPTIDQSFPGTFTWGNFLYLGLFLTEGKTLLLNISQLAFLQKQHLSSSLDIQCCTRRHISLFFYNNA